MMLYIKMSGCSALGETNPALKSNICTGKDIDSLSDESSPVSVYTYHHNRYGLPGCVTVRNQGPVLI